MHGSGDEQANDAARPAATAMPGPPLVPLLVRLLKVAAMISRPMEDDVAARNALSLNELRILMCLHGEGACAGHDITALMAIPPMNVSRALAALARRGWIESALDPANRRRRPVRLSPEGARICQAMEGDIGRVAHYLLGTLTPGDADRFRAMIDQVIGQLDQWPSDHPPPRRT